MFSIHFRWYDVDRSNFHRNLKCDESEGKKTIKGKRHLFTVFNETDLNCLMTTANVMKWEKMATITHTGELLLQRVVILFQFTGFGGIMQRRIPMNFIRCPFFLTHFLLADCFNEILSLTVFSFWFNWYLRSSAFLP